MVGSGNIKLAQWSRGVSYDRFLFAELGEQRNGTALSVISALARLDLDPWSEAAKLAAMPGEAARQRLAALIAPPSGANALSSTSNTVEQLIGLLPSGRVADPHGLVRDPQAASQSRWIVIIYLMIGLALSFGPQLLSGDFGRPAVAPSTLSKVPLH